MIGDTEIIDQIIDAGLKPPETLTLMITDGCNLNCIHCLLDCQPADRASMVPGDIVKLIANEFEELGGESLWLTGGEPLIHPEWMDILEFACCLAGIKEVGLQTNAAPVNESVVQKLLSLPNEKFALQVSLEGAGPDTHDKVRGKGSFEATIKALRLLSKAGLGKHIRVAFTEMRHNFDELPEVLDLVHSLELGNIVSGTLVRGGRARYSDSIALPTSSQIRALITRYHQDPKFSEVYQKIGNIAAIEWFKGRKIPIKEVCTCIRTPFIDARGKMYPCIMYLNDALAAENVHHRSLISVITEQLSEWAELPVRSRERSRTLNACKECPGRTHCGGGCMGRADTVYGHFMSVEDRCHLRRAAYSHPQRF